MSDKQPKAIEGSLSPSERKKDPQAFERTFQAAPLPSELYLPFNAARGEGIRSVGDAYIVLGKDRPSDVESGYFGETNCSTIDIVTGRMARVAQKIRKKNKKRQANPSFLLDAARIYVSQRTDVDENLGLENIFKIKDVTDGLAKNKSAVAIKADGVRIVARESIKLITMTDNYGSSGNRITAKYGIDLIGGGNVTGEGNLELQPLVKGDNLIMALDEMREHLAQLDTQFTAVDKMITQLSTAMVSHMHVPMVPMTPFTSPPVDPISISNNVLTYVDNIMQIVEIGTRQFNHGSWKTNYLTAGGSTYICSPFNKTT